MLRWCACLFVLILTLPAGAPCVSADEHTDFFETHIRPVLVQHCYDCHSATSEEVRGGLLLDSRRGWQAGGDSGPAIVPGDPDQSTLIQALKHEAWEMPPDQRLPDSVIQHFQTWIRNGAVDPRDGGQTLERRQIDLQQGRHFRSFQPVRHPDVPTDSSDWCQTDIDRLLEKHYRNHHVTPAPDATARQVIRRLYFTLTGLPPQPADVFNFDAAWQIDPRTAIANVTDRLLASPRYAERWGRHWLDVTRFAESSGGGRSLMFPHAWRFRDYVIQSFHKDKPLPDLIREHIAGDLLPWDTEEQFNEQVTGSAYLALGPTNYELQDKQLLRMEVVDEQIDTVGRTFLGMSLGCARCHDHKFDPIPTSEYYALAGIFRSTKSLLPGNVSGYVTTELNSPRYKEQLDTWQQDQTRLTADIRQLSEQTGHNEIPKQGGIEVAVLPGIVVDDQQAEFEGTWAPSSYRSPWVGQGYRSSTRDQTGHRVRFRTAVPRTGQYEVRLAHNSGPDRCGAVAVTVRHAEGTTDVSVNQQQAPADHLFTSLGTYLFSVGDMAEVKIEADQSAPGYIIADAVQLLPVDPQSPALSDDTRTRLLVQLTKARQRLRKHKQNKPKPPVTMSVTEQDEPADWHIHLRGNIRRLGTKVPRGFLSVASSQVDAEGRAVPVEIPSGSSGRLELANWIASPDNPLTARVYVNRVWQHLLGAGLVRSPDNFGSTGRAPTHPELLDYLAHTFVHQDHWSTKSLIRRIVTSRMFRLSCTPADVSDPDNLHLTRAFRRPLDADALRDAILSCSGQLDLSVTSGRTISKLTTYDSDYDHTSGTPHVRSVFVPCFRNATHQTLQVFHAANANVVTGQRNEAILPGQALFLLNSPFLHAQAAHTVTRFQDQLSTDHTPSADDIELLWCTLVSRSPTADEVRLVQAVISSQPDKSAAWASVCHALFASIDFRFLD